MVSEREGGLVSVWGGSHAAVISDFFPGNDAAVIDYDSLDEEEEEDEDESCDSENLPSEHDDADDSVQSPLEQHFEYLAEDEDEENEKEDTYHVNATHGNDVKHKKGQSFLSRCRSSISAKFLSRSQKSQGGYECHICFFIFRDCLIFH